MPYVVGKLFRHYLWEEFRIGSDPDSRSDKARAGYESPSSLGTLGVVAHSRIRSRAGMGWNGDFYCPRCIGDLYSHTDCTTIGSTAFAAMAARRGEPHCFQTCRQRRTLFWTGPPHQLESHVLAENTWRPTHSDARVPNDQVGQDRSIGEARGSMTSPEPHLEPLGGCCVGSGSSELESHTDVARSTCHAPSLECLVESVLRTAGSIL